MLIINFDETFLLENIMHFIRLCVIPRFLLNSLVSLRILHFNLGQHTNLMDMDSELKLNSKSCTAMHVLVKRLKSPS